ncbi:MAG: FxsA family protein [Planctomycetales bacterium]
MLIRLLLLLTITPMVELAIFIGLYEITSLQFTFAYIIVTGIIGAWMAREQGASTWRRIQEELVAGKTPADSAMDGLMIVVAGALLITPGTLTDLVGFALLVPACRNWGKARMLAWLMSRVKVQTVNFSAGDPMGDSGELPEAEVISSRVIEEEEENKDD